MENVNTNMPKNVSRKQKPNTNPTNQDNQPKNNQQESKTLDVKRRTRFTDRITLRIDPETKKLLSSFKSKTGITECQLVHALLTGFFYGVGQKIDLDVKSPTINVAIERVVARPRRVSYEGDMVVERFMRESGSGRFVPFYDLDGGVWRVVRVEDGFDVNVNGHFVGCGCRLCNPKAAVKG